MHLFDKSPLLCYNASVKKAVIIAVILALVVSGGVLWKIRENRLATKAAYLEARAADKIAQEQPKSKYDVGPADPTELLELVNAERQRIGVAPLEFDENVRMSAQLKSDDMIAKGYRQHNIPGTNYTLTNEMYAWVSKSCSSSSENFYVGAYNSNPSSDLISTSRRAFEGWMSSEPHRKAIQDPKYKKTGFGVSKDKTTLVAVQHFCIP